MTDCGRGRPVSQVLLALLLLHLLLPLGLLVPHSSYWSEARPVLRNPHSLLLVPLMSFEA